MTVLYVFVNSVLVIIYFYRCGDCCLIRIDVHFIVFKNLFPTYERNRLSRSRLSIRAVLFPDAFISYRKRLLDPSLQLPYQFISRFVFRIQSAIGSSAPISASISVVSKNESVNGALLYSSFDPLNHAKRIANVSPSSQIPTQSQYTSTGSSPSRASLADKTNSP